MAGIANPMPSANAGLGAALMGGNRGIGGAMANPTLGAGEEVNPAKTGLLSKLLGTGGVSNPQDTLKKFLAIQMLNKTIGGAMYPNRQNTGLF